MSLIPAFEIGVWNAWIFIIPMVLKTSIVRFDSGFFLIPSIAITTRCPPSKGSTGTRFPNAISNDTKATNIMKF